MPSKTIVDDSYIAIPISVTAGARKIRLYSWRLHSIHSLFCRSSAQQYKYRQLT